MKERVALLIITLLVLSWAGLDESAAQEAPPIPSAELPAGAEVLTRGPVHEAFAEPIALQPQAGLVAPEQPPANIEETPPDEKPQGSHLVWVPGYWSWDADRSDFIWVSGCWRAAPPKMYWVPGYWVRVSGGWEWVAGFWAPAGAREIDYLPAPPACFDLESSGPPPVAGGIWVPGCWYWQQGRYAARPGYWVAGRADWLWVPSYYCWTPRGYVFVRGYWDYPLEERGLLFAPVYFPPPVRARVGFLYSPGIVIDIRVLVGNLFTCPRYDHYYFGDYYDDAYLGMGIYPWFQGGLMHTWYDPIYAHYRWRGLRTDAQWEEHTRRDYDRRRADRDLRPPRTYGELRSRLANLPEAQRGDIAIGEPLKTFAARKTAPMKFEQMKPGARQKMGQNGSKVRQFREKRAEWETPAGPRPTAGAQPERVKIPSPPLVGKSVAAGGTRRAQPPTPREEHKLRADERRPQGEERKQEPARGRGR